MTTLVEAEVQLRAVEAELENDPDNEDLLLHKEELLEFIELEKETAPPTTSRDEELLPDGGEPSESQSCKKTEENMKRKNAMREKLRKKKLKRQQVVKEQEALAETMMQSWKQFNSKALNKNFKGTVKKSIFASPHTTTGKVGVGTNGIADASTSGIHVNIERAKQTQNTKVQMIMNLKSLKRPERGEESKSIMHKDINESKNHLKSKPIGEQGRD